MSLKHCLNKDNLPKPDRFVDCKGFLCPLPTIRARRALDEMVQDEGVLCIEATDPKSITDMPLFCEQRGHHYLGLIEHEGPVYLHFIKK